MELQRESWLALEVVGDVDPGLPLWPLSGEPMAFGRRAIRISPQESEATRSPGPSPPHSLSPLLGHGRGRRVPAQGHKPALCELSRCCGWTDGRARMREEEQTPPSQEEEEQARRVLQVTCRQAGC